jgi:hypothetical protein
MVRMEGNRSTGLEAPASRRLPLNRGRLWSGMLLTALGVAACTGTIGDPVDLEGRTGSGGPRNGAGASGSGPKTFVASESVGRRLSQAELDNTVRDIFGDTTRPSKLLLEDEYAPYDNDYTLQQASRALIDSLEAFAEDVAKRAVSDPAQRAKIVPCTPTGPGDTACFKQTIETLGQRVFRRPLRAEEVTSYLTLQSFATENNPYVTHDFYTAVDLFIRALLQDPDFLYRVEVGTPTATAGVFSLNSYEIASRLSYLLWGSTPDDELLTDAGGNALATPAQRQAAAERMLQDPRARDQLHRFHAMWLGYRAIPHTAELVAAFNEETTRLIDRVVFDQPQNYLEIFRSTETYLNDLLADHYGLPRPQNGAGWVSYGSSGRAGILSHGSVLAAFSKFSDTSPTQRGIMVRSRLMCKKISPPPANVDVDQPPGDDTQDCKIDRYSAHRSIASCASCHGQMDPIGFGLENYDIGGRFRTHDDGKPQCTITGEGDLPGFGTFSGPAELEQKLIDNNLIQECVVRQFYSFAIGRELALIDLEQVDTLMKDFEAGGLAFERLLVAHVTSAAFALRKEPVTP